MKRALFFITLGVAFVGATLVQLGADLSADTLARPELRSFILTQLRIPRVLVALLVGSTLSVVGGAFQALFRNALATPSTVGTTAGATLGALAALVLDLKGLWGVSAVTLCAFLGALLATSLVLSVASRARARLEEVLLAGIAITLGAGALSQGLHLLADQNALFAAAHWSLGQLPQVGYERVLFLLAPVTLAHAVLLSARRGLRALGWGEERAQTLGINTRRLRLLLLLGGSLGVGACVALCGPIAFVGLLVPHLVRRALGEPAALDLGTIALSGAVFLLLSDTVAHFALSEQELPVGVITAGLGAPALFFLILRPQGHQ